MLAWTLDTELDQSAVEEIGETVSASIDRIRGMSPEQLLQSFLDAAAGKIPAVGSALLIFVVGFVLIRVLLRVIRHLFQRAHLDETLHTFVLSTAKIVLYILLVLSCVGVLGVNLAPFVAALGVFGLAISLAVRDVLTDIAGGISLLFSRPFAKGDYVEIGAQAGTVAEIGIVYTVLTMLDNKRVYLPNGDVSKSSIINYSKEPNRRLDVTFSLRGSSDLVRAKKLMLEVIEKNSLALRDPAPLIWMTDQNFALVKATAMVWVEKAQFLELKNQLITDIRTRLSAEGYE